MSRAELARCETCGATAPVLRPRTYSDGWWVIYGPGPQAGDYCSPLCVAVAFRGAVLDASPLAPSSAEGTSP